MSQPAVMCPKCNSEMESGFLIDRSTYWVTYVGQWAKGDPQLPMWFGPPDVIRQPKARDLIPIRTFRCKSCGFLESYAREEFAPK